MDKETLFSVLRSYCGIEEITAEHSIVGDLGIDGDDADELYFELLNNYGIDLKEIDDIGDCFNSEATLLDCLYFFKWLFYKIGIRSQHPRCDLKPLFVSDILKLMK